MKHINFDRKKQRKLRHKRTTNTLKCAENTRPRLVVTKTDHHIYAQIIDDATSKVLASSSTLTLKLKGNNENEGIKENYVVEIVDDGNNIQKFSYPYWFPYTPYTDVFPQYTYG